MEKVKKPSGGQVKNFKYAENQKLWNDYLNKKIEEGSPKMSINQYKPGLLALEELTGKQFSDITDQDITNLDQQRAGKNIIHVRGFLITMISGGHITPSSRELLISLIPAEYRKLVEIIAEDNKVIYNLAI